MSPGLADSRRALRWRLIRLARWLGLGRLSEWTRLAWQRRSRSHVDLGGVRLRVGAHLSPVISEGKGTVLWLARGGVSPEGSG